MKELAKYSKSETDEKTVFIPMKEDNDITV